MFQHKILFYAYMKVKYSIISILSSQLSFFVITLCFDLLLLQLLLNDQSLLLLYSSFTPEVEENDHDYHKDQEDDRPADNVSGEPGIEHPEQKANHEGQSCADERKHKDGILDYLAGIERVVLLGHALEMGFVAAHSPGIFIFFEENYRVLKLVFRMHKRDRLCFNNMVFQLQLPKNRKN